MWRRLAFGRSTNRCDKRVGQSKTHTILRCRLEERSNARLSVAIREVMWPAVSVTYVSPVEDVLRDDIATLSPDEFFVEMPAIDAR